METTTQEKFNEAADSFVDFERLKKDLKESAKLLTREQVRFLVDVYYQIQESRKRFANQARSAKESAEPNEFIEWMLTKWKGFEGNIKTAMNSYCQAHVPTQWAMSIVGIGPIIAAGLHAHIDITRAAYAGCIWRYAGYDVTLKWLGREKSKEIVDKVIGSGEITKEKLASIAEYAGHKLSWMEEKLNGEVSKNSIIKLLAKRPYNAELKTLLWKLGESFMKWCNHDNDIYGKVYLERKMLEWRKNLKGEYAAEARRKLSEVKIGKDTEAYKWYSGFYNPHGYDGALPPLGEDGKVLLPAANGNGIAMLPPAHILSRSKRYAVKIFISHFHHVLYEDYYKKLPPKPYIIQHGGHTDFIAPPNWPME